MMREKHRGGQCGVLPRIAFALLVLGMGVAAAPSALAADAVNVALVLAANVSRSVDQDEFKLQREGYANAFSDPRVMKAIQAGPHGALAVSFIEWSGASEQKVVVDWSVIRDGESAATFASQLLAAPRSFAGFTSISAAIDFAIERFAAAECKAERRVIDISGDGTNNSGRPITLARDEAVAKGVTINGLAIINLNPHPGYIAHIQPPGGLPNYYRENVIGGPAAFLVVIEDFKSFGQAIANKLIGEIAERRAIPQGKRLAAGR